MEAKSEQPSSEKGKVLSVEKYDQQRKEVTSKWSQVMDSMEEAAPTRGKFFVKVGSTEEFVGRNVTVEDTRALILIESIKQSLNKQLFIAITRDGPKGIQFDKEQGDEISPSVEYIATANLRLDEYKDERRKFSLPDIMRRVTEGEKLFDVWRGDGTTIAVGFLERNNGSSIISFGFVDDSKHNVSPIVGMSAITYTAIPVKDLGLVNKAFEASYASAKLHKDSPHSLEAKELAGSSSRADAVLSIVQNLPPKK